MAGTGLSYEQAPPLGLPLRFFLVSPLFLVLATAVALYAGPDVFASRWTPATLAVTHLMTLGFLGMTMVGALLQMMPVVLGVRLPAVHGVAWSGLVGIASGTLSLAAGLARGDPVWLTLAVVLLGAGMLPFVVAMLAGVARRHLTSDVAWPMRQAWLALALVITTGLWLALGLSGRVALPDVSALVDSHLAWGLGGWVLILVTGVSYQVVPMLQLTPAYPVRAVRWLTWWLLAGLAWTSLARLWPDAPAWCWRGALSMVSAGALAFALLTLWLQKRRRRKVGDATLSFWRFGMACLALFALLLPFETSGGLQIALAVLFLLGFATSVVNGMLYKIVPFLAWFHLQAQRPGQIASIPNMKQYVPEPMAQRHLALHIAGVLVCLAGPWLPWSVVQMGLVLLMVSGVLFWFNLVRARRLFLASGGRL